MVQDHPCMVLDHPWKVLGHPLMVLDHLCVVLDHPLMALDHPWMAPEHLWMVLDHPWMSLDHHSSPKIPETAQSSTSGVSTPRLCGSTRTDYKLGDERVPGNISPKFFAKVRNPVFDYASYHCHATDFDTLVWLTRSTWRGNGQLPFKLQN